MIQVTKQIIKPKSSLYECLSSKLNERLKQGRYHAVNESPNKFDENVIDFLSADIMSFSTDYELRCNILNKCDSIKQKSGLFGHSMTRSMISSKAGFPDNLAFITEQEIAEYHGMKCALFYKCGFDANMSFLGCIASANDFIVYDEYSHRSMMTGIELSRSKQNIPFKHNDVTDLVNILSKIRKFNTESQIIVAIESLYSMHGDIAPLKDFVTQCERFGAYLFVDEAHSFGAYGTNGLGLMHHNGLCTHPNVIAILATYAKSLAATGAALLLNSDILHEYLNQYSITTVFSHYLPNSALLSIQCGYQYLMTEKIQNRREYLQEELVKYFVASCQLKLPSKMCQHLSSTHLQPIVIGNDELCKEMVRGLWNCDIAITSMQYPIVPKDFAIIRVWLHAHNTKQQIDKLLNIISGSLQ